MHRPRSYPTLDIEFQKPRPYAVLASNAAGALALVTGMRL